MASQTAFDPRTVPGAVRGKLPKRVQPALATLSRAAPEGDRWLHEIKYDGYRMLCIIEGRSVRLLSRNGLDWTGKLQPIAKAARSLPLEQAVLDGEAVVFLPSGATSFQALQNAIGSGDTGQVLYYVFDWLYADGYDLTRAALKDRKGALEELLLSHASPAADRVRYSEHIVGDGPQVFQQACQMGVEGIVSKRCDRPYTPGRTADWLKIKCLQSEEFVIGGFTRPSGSRIGFGALLLGYFDSQGRLIYVGRVGTGFTEQTLRELTPRLKALQRETSPFANLPTRGAPREVLWANPELVAQVEFGGCTDEGILRHSAFRGLREDRSAGEIVREEPVPQARKAAPPQSPAALSAGLADFRLTNPDRIVYPGQGITKLGLASYYAQVHEWILPHVAGRLLTLVRCPEGSHKQCFYQKHAPPGLPPSVKRIPVQEKNKTETYLAIDSIEELLGLVQLGVVEFHVWGSRIDKVELPDRLVFDLDPDPAVPWRQVKDAAAAMRDFLAELGLRSFLRTTGGKGLHVVVPLTRREAWDEIKLFTKRVAEAFTARNPDRYTSVASKARRTGKIYVDYLRNGRGATAIASYSTRARSGAPVATPLAWEELRTLSGSDRFTVDTLPRRLANLQDDPWAEIGSVRQSITRAARKAVGQQAAGSRQ